MEKDEMFVLQGIQNEKLAEAKAQGKKDGERNIPHSESEVVSSYEKKMVTFYQSLIEKINQIKITKSNDCSLTKIKKAEDEYEALQDFDVDGKIEDNKLRHGIALETEVNRYEDEVKQIHNGSAWNNIQEKYNEAKTKMQNKYHRLVTNQKYSSWLLLLLAPVIVGEVFLNKTIFDYYELEKIPTYLMIGSISIIFLIGAHTSGKAFRQLKDSFTNNLIWIITTFGACMTVTISLPYIREAKEETFSSEDFWLFIGVGILMYLSGAIIAYYTTDSSSTFKKDLEEFSLIKLKYDTEATLFEGSKATAQTAYNTRIAEIHEKLDNRNSYAKRTVKSKKAEAENLRIENNNITEFYNSMQLECNNLYKESIQEYRKENLLFREGRNQVNIWDNEINDLNLN